MLLASKLAPTRRMRRGRRRRTRRRQRRGGHGAIQPALRARTHVGQRSDAESSRGRRQSNSPVDFDLSANNTPLRGSYRSAHEYQVQASAGPSRSRSPSAAEAGPEIPLVDQSVELLLEGSRRDPVGSHRPAAEALLSGGGSPARSALPRSGVRVSWVELLTGSRLLPCLTASSRLQGTSSRSPAYAVITGGPMLGFVASPM